MPITVSVGAKEQLFFKLDRPSAIHTLKVDYSWEKSNLVFFGWGKPPEMTGFIGGTGTTYRNWYAPRVRTAALPHAPPARRHLSLILLV